MSCLQPRKATWQGKNETITIDNTIVLDGISTEIDAEMDEAMNPDYSLLNDDDDRLRITTTKFYKLNIKLSTFMN